MVVYPGGETQQELELLLLRLAHCLVREPVASSIVLGLLVGGIGGNAASFALGTIVGLAAASILRRHEIAGTSQGSFAIQPRLDAGTFLFFGGLGGMGEAVFGIAQCNPLTVAALCGALAVAVKKLLFDRVDVLDRNDRGQHPRQPN